MLTGKINTMTYKDGANVYFFAIIINILLQGVLSIILAAFGATSILSIDYVNIIFSLVIECGYIAVAVVYMRKKKVQPDIGLQQVKPMGYAMSVFIAVVCIFCFYLTASSFQLLLDKIGYVSQGGMELKSLAAKILGVIVTCIAAPIAEELIFRGALLSGLVKNFKAPAAVVLSALAFSFMHMNPEQTVYQFLLGIVLGIFALKSGSLLPPIIIHAASNLIAVLLEIVPPFNAALVAAMEYLLANMWLFIFLTIVLFFVGVAIVFFAGKFMARTKTQKLIRIFPARRPLISELSDDGNRREAADGLSAGENDVKPVNEFLKTSFKPRTVFLVTLGICLFMWLSVFFISMFTYLFPAA